MRLDFILWSLDLVDLQVLRFFGLIHVLWPLVSWTFSQLEGPFKSRSNICCCVSLFPDSCLQCNRAQNHCCTYYNTIDLCSIPEWSRMVPCDTWTEISPDFHTERFEREDSSCRLGLAPRIKSFQNLSQQWQRRNVRIIIHKAVLIMLLVQIWEVMIQKQSGELFFGGLKCLLMMKGSSKPFVMSGLLMWLWEGFRLDFELGDRLPLRENETRDQKKKMTKNSIDSDFLPFCLCNRWEGKC